MSDSNPGNINLGLEVFKGLGGKLLQAVLGFAGTIVFARELGPAAFGGFYLLLSVVQLVNRPVMGIATATKKRFSEADADHRNIFSAQLVLNAAIFVAVSVAVFLFSAPLESYTGLDSAALLFVPLFAAVLLFAPTQDLVTGTGKVSAPIWIDTLRSVLTFPLQLALVLLGLGAAGMAFGLSLATFLCLPISLYYLRTVPTVPDWDTLQSIWDFAQFSVVSRIVGRAYDEFDPLLLGYLLAPAAAGYYQVAYKLIIPGTFVTVVASSGIIVKVSNLDSKGESVRNDVTNTVSFASVLAIPLFFGALTISRPLIVTAYGAEYAAATDLLVGLALFAVVRTQTTILENVINGLDKPALVVRGSAAALVINIGVGVPLTLEFGPIGVVVATVLAESLRYALFAVVVKRETAADVLPRPLFEQVFAGGIMFAAIDIIERIGFAVSSWVELAALIGVGGVVYFLALSVISDLFRHTVRGVLRDAQLGPLTGR